MLGLSISAGMVCKTERIAAEALAGPVAELAGHIHEVEAVNIDETGWREGRRRAWLWAVLTPLVVVFRIAPSRGSAVAVGLQGDRDGQVVTSDRFGAYEWTEPSTRQVCWVHLWRDFRAMIDRGGPAEEVSSGLLKLSDRLFEAWHRARDGTIGRPELVEAIGPPRAEVRRALESGSRSGCVKTAASCWEILKVEPGLWGFARHAVIWRRVNGGTDGESGSRFAERVLSVVGTCRQQGRDVLGYLTSCFEARLSGRPIPSLLPAEKPGISDV